MNILLRVAECDRTLGIQRSWKDRLRDVWNRGFKILNFPLADITVGNEHLYNLAIHGRKHFVVTAVIGVHQNIATENLSGTRMLYTTWKTFLCKL